MATKTYASLLSFIILFFVGDRAMAEVNGSVILKLPQQLVARIEGDSSTVTWSSIEEIFKISNLHSLDKLGLSHMRGTGFDTEGIQSKGDYLLIYPFSD